MNIKLDEMRMAYEDFVANNRLQETWEQFVRCLFFKDFPNGQNDMQWEDFMTTLKETFEMWMKLWEEFKSAWENFWQTFFEMWKKIYEKIIKWINDNEELADIKRESVSVLALLSYLKCPFSDAIEQLFVKLAEWTNMRGAKEKFDDFVESMKKKYGYYGKYQVCVELSTQRTICHSKNSYLSFGLFKKVYDWIEPMLSELATIDLHEISSKLLNAEFWTGEWSHKKIKDILPRVREVFLSEREAL